jgi:alpha-galactosidase
MQPTLDELSLAHDYVARVFSAGGAAPAPFSFRYGGQPSAELLPGWERTAQSAPLDGSRTTHTLRLRDPQTGLEVRAEAVEYHDLPAVEWTVYLRNTGQADTPLLEQIQALDVLQPCAEACLLHYSLGALCSVDDFAPVERRFNRGARLRLTPGGGRSSSEVLPFFNVERQGEGTIVAIGWTGEWAAEFTRTGDGTLRVQAGMDLTHLVLHPGEEIRAPRILLLFWQGERLRGHNLLRQLILRYHRPTVDGRPLVVPTFCSSWGATPAEIHLGNIDRLDEQRLPTEYYWIDAAWFGEGDWYQTVGSWQPKADLYPQGLRAVSDALHRNGRRFLLWFEPQRVARGSAWAREHPEWLLHIRPEDEQLSWPVWADTDDPLWRFAESKRNRIAPGDGLLNLALPEARRFLTDFISHCIDEFGLDCYREDFNIAPLAFWRRADAPDRQGMTEIRWVEGLYAFWDELLARHPGLMIDNCASGGRRIDLETLGRAMPLYRSDNPFDPIGRQGQTYGLSLWVPLYGAGGQANLAKASDYEFRSSLCAGLLFSFLEGGDSAQTGPFPAGLPYERARSLLEQYERLRPYLYGEYYPLSEYSPARDAWLAYQFHRPDLGEGMAIVFKRPRSALREAAYSLQGLEPAAQYEVRNLDTGEVRVLTGAALAAGGLTVRLDERPASSIAFCALRFAFCVSRLYSSAPLC